MCGIVCVNASGKKCRASKVAFRRYEGQKKRGNEGYGCVSMSHGKVTNLYRSEDEAGIRKILSDKGSMILFHHRKPTSTPNYTECTHPIFVSNEKLEYDYYVVHNGIIENALFLKGEYEKLGFEYTTEVQEMYKTKGKIYEGKTTKFNDSESLAIDLAVAIEEGRTEIKSRGSIAFVALQVDKNTKDVGTIFFGRNNRNPLVLDESDGGFILSSEGEGNEIEAHKLFAYDTKSKKVTSSDLMIGINYPVPPPAKVPYDKPDERQRSLYWEEEEREAMGFLPPPSRSGNGSHHATHDIMRNVASEFARGRTKMSKKERTRYKYGIVESTMTVYNRYGLKDDITFKVQGCFLYRTRIDISRIATLYQHEWEWYLRVIRDYDQMVEMIRYNTKMKIPFEKDLCISKLKSLSVELESITRTVNKRPLGDDFEIMTDRERTEKVGSRLKWEESEQ